MKSDHHHVVEASLVEVKAAVGGLLEPIEGERGSLVSTEPACKLS